MTHSKPDPSRSAPPSIRRAGRADVPAIAHLLADDALRAEREALEPPFPQAYFAAFETIDRDPNNELTVVEILQQVQHEGATMITCYVRYQIDPAKLAEFETYGRKWIQLVEKFGGIHHGYFLPCESANDLALALFSFPSLAAYEQYRHKSANDAECQAVNEYAQETQCVKRYDRQFLRPIMPK